MHAELKVRAHQHVFTSYHPLPADCQLGGLLAASTSAERPGSICMTAIIHIVLVKAAAL